MTAVDHDMSEVARRARTAYLELLGCTEAERNEALSEIAVALRRREEEIVEANRRDLEKADQRVIKGEMSRAMRKRLVFDANKLQAALEGVEQIIALPDPTGKIISGVELDDGLILRRVSCSLGVIGVIFESRPEVVIQVSSLLLKAGNTGILKGGMEAQHTNWILMDTIRSVLQQSTRVSVDALQILSTRQQIRELLACEGMIDLLIPRGSKELVRAIQSNTRIPVLGHTDGICHVYVHQGADRDKAIRVTVDSKTEYPAVCNAAETLLIDKEVAPALMPSIINALRDKNVRIRGCRETSLLIPDVEEVSDQDFYTEYLDLTINVKVVADLQEAIDHINCYGSSHTDAIVTEDSKAAEIFCRYVDSAGVFVNASTRFSDGFRYGLGAEIGISTNKIHARGPVGLEGILSYKYELCGDGHIVDDYNSQIRSFKWRKL